MYYRLHSGTYNEIKDKSDVVIEGPLTFGVQVFSDVNIYCAIITNIGTMNDEIPKVAGHKVMYFFRL